MDMKGKNKVKIAVAYENGDIFQQFDKTKQLKIFETDNGKIVHQKVVDVNDIPQSSLGSYLSEQGVTVLICGELACGEAKALHNAGILIYAGNGGSVDDAVNRLMNNELFYDPGAHLSEDSGCACCVGQQDYRMEIAAEIGRSSGHNYYRGGHNRKDVENTGHNHRLGHEN